MAFKFIHKAIFGLLIFWVSIAKAEYYEVIDPGRQYPWFANYEARARLIDKHMNYISKKLREKLLKQKPDLEFYAIKGDVGKLVANLDEISGLVVLDISGYWILIRKDAVQPTSKLNYDKFYSELISKGQINQFGLSLGKTTYEEAQQVLFDSNADFNHKLAYRGDISIPVIQVNKYQKMPVINKQEPRDMTLWFVNDKLYQIDISWFAKTTFVSDINYFNDKNISTSIRYALEQKYGNRSFISDAKRDGKIRSTKSVSPFTKIYLTFYYSDNSPNPYGFTLSYVDIDLESKAEVIKKSIDERISNEERLKQQKKRDDIINKHAGQL